MILLGKKADDLQSNVKINESLNRITGELKYVKGYEEFSSVPSEKEGTYLALKIDSSVADASIDVELSKKVKLDHDKTIVLRITEATKRRPLKVTVSENGNKDVVSYDISGLKLTPKPEEE